MYKGLTLILHINISLQYIGIKPSARYVRRLQANTTAMRYKNDCERYYITWVQLGAMALISWSKGPPTLALPPAKLYELNLRQKRMY